MLGQAAIIAVSSGLGYLLPAIIGLESMGVPSPGETALVLAAVLASQGKLNIWLVILIGIASAILGDNVGYALGRPFWNRGYATEAARAGLRWAKRDWGRKVVVAGHFADNPASGQVLCKAGFLYTGDVEKRACAARGGELVPTRLMVWLA